MIHKATTTNAALSLRAHVTKKDETVIEVKDSVLKQSAVNKVEAAVEAEVDLGGSGEVKAAVEAEVNSGSGLLSRSRPTTTT
jgi:hypothetical protein